jgi:aspartyl-tRNA(Asn)/glutamyl-tRNA(Gln) amidotransferase subunit A
MALPTDGATIDSLARDLRRGRVSAAEITEACLDRIRAGNARLNAFILVMEDEARRQAEAADRELAAGVDRGPLHGIPVSIKDLVDVAGTPTTAASRVREGHVARRDATVVQRLRRAGAVIIGKTNLHEFAFGTTNEDSAYGPSRNPFDASRSPGGSSGGSAVSVATGMALATVGTDTGGSIRIPAAACGVVGLKPSYGETPIDGVVPLSTTLDHVGPLARSVADAWTMHGVLAGAAAVQPLAEQRPADIVLGVPRGYFCDVLDTAVRRAFEQAISALRAAGCRIEDVEIAHAALIAPVYLHLVFGDAAAYHARTLEAMPERYTVPVRLRLEMARYVLAEDYVRARRGREALRREVDAALVGRNALVLPTLPIPAPPLGAASVEVDGKMEPVRNLMLRLTQLFNITGHPAISVPCGRTIEGLPVGLQLAAPTGQTAALAATALALERLR